MCGLHRVCYAVSRDTLGWNVWQRWTLCIAIGELVGFAAPALAIAVGTVGSWSDTAQVVAAARQRQPDLAIIVLTGHGSLDTAVEGLHQGIFDYLLKTTEPAQVIERVKVGLAACEQALRQHTLLDVVGTAIQELRGGQMPGAAGQSATPTERILTVGAFRLDTWRQVATLAGRTLALTPTEFRLLLCLAEHAGTMLSYAQLVRCTQGYDAGELEAGELIKPHIHHLRQKLEPDPGDPRYILNVRGKGYLLSPVGE